VKAEDFIEDVEFMLNTGENLRGVARRLGMEEESVVKHLRRIHAPALALRCVGTVADPPAPIYQPHRRKRVGPGRRKKIA